MGLVVCNIEFFNGVRQDYVCKEVIIREDHVELVGPDNMGIPHYDKFYWDEVKQIDFND